MNDPIRDAIARLGTALDRLDAVSIRHVEAERTRLNLETELGIMREDRAELARLLDTERAARLGAEGDFAELMPRIDRAIGLISPLIRER